MSRRNISDAERAHLGGRRKEIYEAIHPHTTHGGDRKGSSRQIGDLNSRFTASTAKASDRSERDVQRDAERAQRIGDDTAKIVARSVTRVR